MEEKTPSRRLRKKNNTHKALMHSAKSLFEKKGFGNVTIDEISEAADVSRSTFFTHFNSVDDLIEQIANEEIDDLAAVWQNSSEDFSITALLYKLIEDSCPYPYLTGELLMRGILSKGGSSFNKIFDLAENHISEKKSYSDIQKEFSAQEVSAILMGGYFGLLFQKFIRNEKFDSNSEIEMKATIKKLIDNLKN